MTKVGLDYNFAGEDDEDAGTWLTMVDSRSKAVWTRIVEAKGWSEETSWVIVAVVELKVVKDMSVRVLAAAVVASSRFWAASGANLAKSSYRLSIFEKCIVQEDRGK